MRMRESGNDSVAKQQQQKFLTVSQTRLYNESLRAQSRNNSQLVASKSKKQRESQKSQVEQSIELQPGPVETVSSENSLRMVLKMVLSEIKEGKFNASRRRIFLTFLQSVDFRAISMQQSTWANLVTGLKVVANQPDAEESDQALNIFAEIIAVRPYDTSQVMTLLQPEVAKTKGGADSKDIVETEGAVSTDGIDLASFGANKATDFFILKFLMCNELNQDGTVPEPEEEKEEVVEETSEKETEEDDAFVITDQKTAKKYAITSYLKLLTPRVLRLEQDMARHKKVSVIMMNEDGEKQEEEGKDKEVKEGDEAEGKNE